MVNKETGKAIIKFDTTTSSRLKYWINTSGIRLDVRDNIQEIDIEVYNSRDQLTPGHISIPFNSLNELINDLIQLQAYAESKKNHTQ